MNSTRNEEQDIQLEFQIEELEIRLASGGGETVLHPGLPEQGGGRPELEGVPRRPRVEDRARGVGEGRPAGREGRSGVDEPDGLLADAVKTSFTTEAQRTQRTQRRQKTM